MSLKYCIRLSFILLTYIYLTDFNVQLNEWFWHKSKSSQAKWPNVTWRQGCNSFFLTGVIRLVYNNKEHCFKLLWFLSKLHLFMERKYSCFSWYCCIMNITDICKKFILKIIIWEWNLAKVFFLSILTNIYTSLSKEINHPFFVSS